MHHDQNQMQVRKQQRSHRRVGEGEGRDNPDGRSKDEEEGNAVTDFLTSDDNLSSRSNSAPPSPSATSDSYHSDDHARRDRRDGRRGEHLLDDDEDDLVCSFIICLFS